MSWKLGLRTRAVHAGGEADTSTGAAIPPLVMSNSFAVDAGQPFSIEELGDDAPFIYTRWGNPTLRRLEARVASLEQGEAAVAVASGMAALNALLLHHLSQGDHLVVSNVAYAGLIELTNDLQPRLGIQVSQVDSSDAALVANAIRDDTKLILIETPCNPIVRLADIAAIAEVARAADVPLAVDSTFASPAVTRPLELGADYVVHSLTKYLGGHGDALGGVIVGRHEPIERIRRQINVHVGGVMSPFNAWLILRGITTLPMRMRAHSEAAMRVAEFLEAHPRVQGVRYPGLRSHPQHDLARRQMDLFSGMMAVRIDGGPAVATQLSKRLEVFTHGVSLGQMSSLLFYLDTDSLMSTTFRLQGDELAKYREAAGDGVFRVSVGIEDPDDLCADLERALES